MPPSKLYTADHNLTEYGVPYRGLWLQTPTFATPGDGLRACRNVVVRDGVLVPRPGYSRFTDSTFTGTPNGAYPYVAINDFRAPIVSTVTHAYQYHVSWQDITPNGGADPFTASPLQLMRFTTIVLGADTLDNPLEAFVFASNGADTPVWTYGAGRDFEPTGGQADPDTDPDLILLFTDLCTIADKIVGIVPPYLVAWSTTLPDPTLKFSFQNGATWPQLNRHQEAATPDRVVAIRNLGTVAGCVYKQRSLWNISTTGAQSEAAAFRFDLIGMYDGPAGPAAVVDCNGVHVRLTLNGRLGLYNGGSHQWVGDGAWKYLREDLRTSAAVRTHGWYDSIRDEVWFVYPSEANEGKMTGLIIVSFPKPEWGVQGFGVFVGQLAHEITAGCVDRQENEVQRILIAGDDTTKRPYLVGLQEGLDDDVPITGYWQTGLSATPGREPIQLESVETFASRGEGYGTLSLQGVYSWTLANEGTLTPAVTVSLETPDEPVRQDENPPGHRGRFLGLRYEFDASESTIEYKGAVLKAEKSVL